MGTVKGPPKNAMLRFPESEKSAKGLAWGRKVVMNTIRTFRLFLSLFLLWGLPPHPPPCHLTSRFICLLLPSV